MNPGTPGRRGGTTAPQTPRNKIIQQVTSPATPLTPHHQNDLYGKFREIAAMVANERDEAQRKAIVGSLLEYSQLLADKHGVEAKATNKDTQIQEQESNDLGDFIVNDQGHRMVSFMARENNAQEEASQHEAVFAPITLAISPVWSIEAITRMRAKFFRSLLEMQILVTKNRVQEVQNFSQDDAVAITNFFFMDVLGEKAVSRLTTIVKYYQSDHPGGLDKGAGARALLAINAPNLPTQVKDFMRSFSRARGPVNNAPKEFTSVAQFMMDIQLLNSFTELKAAAENKNAALIQFLASNGYVTSRGVDYKTLIIRYVANALTVPQNVLVNTCQSALGIKSLYTAFGPGILTLLPPGSETKLNVWGNQRMSYVYTLLKQEAQCIQPICDMLKEHLFYPILNGQRLTINALKGGTKESSFLEKVQEAVSEYSQTENDGAGQA